MRLTIKDIAIALAMLINQNEKIAIIQLNQMIKKILKPSMQAQNSLNKYGVKP